MYKRKASTDLNHDNWNDVEEPEVAGTFQRSSAEVLKERVIRSPRRRLQQSGGVTAARAGGSSSGKKIFAEFTGSMKMADKLSSISEVAKNSFSFLKKSDTPLKTNSSETKKDGENSDAHKLYLGKLKGLNEAVLDWIKQHVESNPCCLLTPVFRDYDNYLKEIQNEKEKADESVKVGLNSNSELSKKDHSAPMPPSGNSGASETKPPPSTFFFGSSDKPAAPSFNFGSKNASGMTNIFGVQDSSEKTTPPFTLSSHDSVFKKNEANKNDESSGTPEKKPFLNFGSSIDKPSLDIKFPSTGSFTSSLNKPSNSTGDDNNENGDNSDDPPPEPIKLVSEDDAVFTQRVKVFVKKGDSYSDLGVGNLFIKEAPNGWHQAIVRNDTSLGNVIFNILLSSLQPTQRLGKNNVVIVCQPTPQHSGLAVPVLLRVKTAEDADKLLETIEKYKKK